MKNTTRCYIMAILLLITLLSSCNPMQEQINIDDSEIKDLLVFVDSFYTLLNDNQENFSADHTFFSNFFLERAIFFVPNHALYPLNLQPGIPIDSKEKLEVFMSLFFQRYGNINRREVESILFSKNFRATNLEYISAYANYYRIQNEKDFYTLTFKNEYERATTEEVFFIKKIDGEYKIIEFLLFISSVDPFLWEEVL